MKKSIKSDSAIQGNADSKIKIKKDQKRDNANLSKIKSDASGDKKGNLYIGFSNLSALDQKKERSKLRRKLEFFRKEILGKDRSKEEKEKGLNDFLAFYKMHWKIQDFRFENFSHQSDSDFKSDFELILSMGKKRLEK